MAAHITNTEGWVAFDTIGRIDFMVSKTGYLTNYGNVTITQAEVVKIGLEPLRNIHFELAGFKGEPLPGATIQIAEKELIADQFGSVSTELSDGTYPYLVEEVNHQPFKDTLEVNLETADSTFVIEMIPVTNMVTFTVNDGLDPIAQATVEVEEDILITNASGVASVNLINGSYGYRAFAINTDTAIGTVVVDGDEVEETVVLNLLSSMEELLQNGIQFYPNPARNNVTIEIGEMSEGTMELINTRGAVVFKTRLNSSKSTVNLAGLEEGAYIILIRNSEKQFTGKITLF